MLGLGVDVGIEREESPGENVEGAERYWCCIECEGGLEAVLETNSRRKLFGVIDRTNKWLGGRCLKMCWMNCLKATFEPTL